MKLRSRELVRVLTPPLLMRVYRALRLFHSRQRDRRLTRKDLFTRIYRKHEWGGEAAEYCSGAGSTASHADQYAAVVRRFIEANRVASVVDIGCGDFSVGRRLRVAGVPYTGVDIVEDLILRNQKEYGDAETHFVCADAVTDPLPPGELCLVRQVLQHLSNEEIAAILRKLHAYRYVMITEHLPAPHLLSVANRDKPHGPDTRVYDGSGVFVDRPPFSMSVSRVLLDAVAESPLVAPGEVIRTVLIEPEAPARG